MQHGVGQGRCVMSDSLWAWTFHQCSQLEHHRVLAVAIMAGARANHSSPLEIALRCNVGERRSSLLTFGDVSSAVKHCGFTATPASFEWAKKVLQIGMKSLEFLPGRCEERGGCRLNHDRGFASTSGSPQHLVSSRQSRGSVYSRPLPGGRRRRPRNLM